MKTIGMLALTIGGICNQAVAATCDQWADLAQTAAEARDHGVSQRKTLRALGSAIEQTDTIAAGADVVNLVYTDPRYIAMRPRQVHKFFADECHRMDRESK